MSEEKDYVDMIDKNHKTPKVRFIERMKAVEQEHVKNSRPYDARAAIIEYERRIATIQSEASIRGENDPAYIEQLQKKDLSLPEIDLQQFGNPKHFELIGVTEAIESKVLDGVKQDVQVGYNIEYVTKLGTGITVYIQNRDWETKAPKEAQELIAPKVKKLEKQN